MAIVERVRDYSGDSIVKYIKNVKNPFLFQVYMACHTKYGKSHYLERKQESTYDLRLFKKGTFLLTVGGIDRYITSPAMLLFDHYSTIKVRPIEGEDFEEFALYFTGPHIDEYVNAIIPEPGNIFVRNYNADFFAKTLDEIFEIMDTSKDRERISMLLYALLLDLVKLNKTTTYSLPIQKTKKWLEDNYNKDLKLANISEYVGYSNYYLDRLFKKEVGVSPMEYVRKIRLEKGLILLTTTSKTITTISQEVGFADRRSFVTYFKEKMGVTPNEYKKEYLKGNDN